MTPFTGVGSRKTPSDVLATMTAIARFLTAHGYVLRSGGAEGADTAFEEGAVHAEIYLPWNRFEGHDGERRIVHGQPFPAGHIYYIGVGPQAMELAERHYDGRVPWHRLKTATQKLMARNGYQVLGRTLDQPSRFVVCWTEGGRGEGGTGQAIRVARAYQVPVFDLGEDGGLDTFREWVRVHVVGEGTP